MSTLWLRLSVLTAGADYSAFKLILWEAPHGFRQELASLKKDFSFLEHKKQLRSVVVNSCRGEKPHN
jgi:hypothetical protein